MGQEDPMNLYYFSIYDKFYNIYIILIIWLGRHIKIENL